MKQSRKIALSAILREESIDEHICGGGFLYPLYFFMVDLFKEVFLFMKFLKLMNRYKIVIILFCFTFFLFGYFITDYFINNQYARYRYNFIADTESVECLLDENFYDQVFAKIEEHNLQAEQDSSLKKISYAKIDYKDMLQSAKIEKQDTHFTLSIKKKFFPNLVSSSTGKVNQSENRVKNYFNLIGSYTNYNMEFISVELLNNQNPYWIGGYCALSSLVISVIGLGIYLIYKKDFVVIEDNINVYTSIFHRKYWKESMGFINSVKKMCTISILFACMLICKLIPIPSGFGNLGISFTYLFFGVICWIYGPCCGLFIGFCSDILGYFIHPSGMFFMGYTLDAMLAGFIYGVCFYKKRITFANCLVARIFVNLFVNVGLGSLWWKIIYHLDFDAYLTYVTFTSLPKNLLYLLPQSILLFLLFKALSKTLASLNLIDKSVSENINLF